MFYSNRSSPVSSGAWDTQDGRIAKTVFKGAWTRGLPPITKPFIFYFSLMIDAYETTTSLLRIVRHCYS